MGRIARCDGTLRLILKPPRIPAPRPCPPPPGCYNGRVTQPSVKFSVVVALLAWVAGCTTPKSPVPATEPVAASRADWPRHVLALDDFWRLNPPLPGQRFDASGLAFLPSGELLVVNNLDRRLHLVRFGDTPHEADLVPWPGGFSAAQLRPFAAGKRGAWDFEGLAVDEAGRVYVSEEGNYQVLRLNPAGGAVERLPLDWRGAGLNPLREDPNASLEGVAVGGGRLYVAKERGPARLFAFHDRTFAFAESWVVRPSRSGLALHYSDLAWCDGALYVLLRHQRCVLKVDPARGGVRAEYDFRELERRPEFAYRRDYATGVMEGLAVDATHFWLVTDNNGLARRADAADSRPTLFRCPRPDL